MIDPEWLKIASHEMLVGEGVRVLLHSWVVGAITDGDQVKGGITDGTSNTLQIGEVAAKPSSSLQQACATGKHYDKATLNVR